MMKRHLFVSSVDPFDDFDSLHKAVVLIAHLVLPRLQTGLENRFQAVLKRAAQLRESGRDRGLESDNRTAESVPRRSEEPCRS